MQSALSIINCSVSFAYSNDRLVVKKFILGKWKSEQAHSEKGEVIVCSKPPRPPIEFSLIIMPYIAKNKIPRTKS